MSAEAFWSATIKEVQLCIRAYNKRENEAWQRTRLQAYLVYCSATDENKRKPIYEFLKLDGDPSPEEILEMNIQQGSQEDNEMLAAYEEAKLLNII